MIETMAGGVAAFDYNHDGKVDIFFTNGAAIPSFEKDSPKFFNRLYRNDGGMKFTDVTLEAGVAGAGYSMGAAAADYNNDGYTDLFVAGVYRNILYRNLGNGKFEDVTEERASRATSGRSPPAGSTTTTTAGWTYSSSIMPTGLLISIATAVIASAICASIAIQNISRVCLIRYIVTVVTEHLKTSAKKLEFSNISAEA